MDMHWWSAVLIGQVPRGHLEPHVQIAPMQCSGSKVLQRGTNRVLARRYAIKRSQQISLRLHCDGWLLDC